jgi:perosamine synthetase
MLCHTAGVGEGDEVITSPISFVATANCFIFEGGRPVFADVDPQTLNLDPGAVEAAITERTKGIVVVDMFGYPCELDELREIADRHGLWLIDDSCEALGAEYKGQTIGSHGVSGAFGFYPNKQLTTGEGGMVTTHSEDEWQVAKSLRNQGRSYDSRWFHHVRLGFNYRITDLQAALGIAQLEKLDRMLELRSEAAARYAELLAGVDGLEAPLADDAEHTRSWFVYVVKLAGGIDRGAVLQSLGEQGIEAGLYVPAVHLQPYMRERYGFSEGLCPVAEDACARTLALPFFPQLEPPDQELVVEALQDFLNRA